MKFNFHSLPVLTLSSVLLLYACHSAVAISPIPPSTTAPTPKVQTPTPAKSPTPLSIPTAGLACTPDYCIQPGVFPLSRPILPPRNDRVDETYRYGYTQNITREPHHGVEFNNPVGTPVQAAAEGTVLYAGTDSTQVFGLYPNFYGNLVILQHDLPGFDTPVYSLYGHLSAIDVKTGDTVSRGEVIGEVGLSGSAIGAHLHFEVRMVEPTYDHTANPELFLPPLPALDTALPTGILTGRIEDQFGSPLKIPISIQPVLPDGSLGPALFPELYGAGMPPSPAWGENFLVSGLPAGKYRVAFVNYSKVFERVVEIIPGGVTFVKIQAKP